jgi:hypothetical protein
MKYIIVDTWNGESYSDSGIIGRAKDKDEATEIVANEFKNRYFFSKKKFECESFNNVSLSYDDGEDQGCIRAIEIGIDDRFVIINPMVNDVKVVTDSFNLIRMMLMDLGSTEEGIYELEQRILEIGNGMINHNDGELIIYKL